MTEAVTLTPEQQAEVEIRLEIERRVQADNRAQQREMIRLEALRLAKETLVENSRSKPVSERDVTSEDITAFAATLVTYVTVE